MPENDYKKLVDLFFKDITMTPEDIFKKYKKRELPVWSVVTRIPPSPTWFMHIWTLYTALINERIAHQSNKWLFYLRIEDTDTKRNVEWATNLIIKTLDDYNIKIDEWVDESLNEFWEYWPYFQSQRSEIYWVFIKDLFERWYAYPCFCSSEELEQIRDEQNKVKAKPWYYWEWAKWRFASIEEIMEEYNKGTPYVIRFKSPWNGFKKVVIKDELKWKIEMAENDLDIVIQKWDWLPTYHLAHVIDDYLMWTTLVLRWDEWLASLPLHYQLFDVMGWEKPKYGHLAPIQKTDNWNKRKLSKRKDPEATMSYYDENGYPRVAVLEYLINLANSNFEDWRKQNPETDMWEFEFSISKLANHKWWALFDFQKLDNISKEIISNYSAEKVYEEVLAWSEKYDSELFALLSKNKEYSISIFNVEREWAKKRKDIAKWWETRENIYYFFDELFTKKVEYKEVFSNLDEGVIKGVLNDYINSFDENDSKDEWFAKLKETCLKNGFADNNKSLKENPEMYKWSIVDVSNMIRLFLTWSTRSPDLYEITKVMWTHRVKNRFTI